MITTFYPPYSFGGDGVYVHSLANALARRGHEVDVIHCVDSYNALSRGPLPTGYANEAGVTVHGLISRAGILSPLATYLTGAPFFKEKKIKEILARKKFDVIHFHNISLVGGPKILSFGQAVKLYTLHEYWLICPTHVLFKYKKQACVKKDCFKCQLTYFRPPQVWRYSDLLKKNLSHVDAFIAPAEFTRLRHFAEGLDIPIFHLPNFFNAPRESSQTFQDDFVFNKPFFFFAGRLEKLKGVQTLIPLFKKQDKVDLVIAGDGNYAGKLKRLARGSNRIHFLGRISQAELRTWYERAIALLVPSLWVENSPLIIAEAFAASTPVIARRIGALQNIIEESGGGLTFGDDQELLGAMEKLRTDTVLRNQLGQNGYRTYQSEWTEEVCLERYFRLIEEIQDRKYASLC